MEFEIQFNLMRRWFSIFQAAFLGKKYNCKDFFTFYETLTTVIIQIL